MEIIPRVVFALKVSYAAHWEVLPTYQLICISLYEQYVQVVRKENLPTLPTYREMKIPLVEVGKLGHKVLPPPPFFPHRCIYNSTYGQVHTLWYRL